MKRALSFVLFTALLAGGTCWAQMGKVAVLSPSAAGTAHPSPYNFPSSQYPRIEADNRVTFQFRAPDAQKVQVAIASTPFDMVKGDNGVWTYTTQEPQDLGYHNYWMIVDGAVVVDPATDAFIGYSHMCNAFEVPDPNGGFYELKDVPHGNVLIKNYFAKSINSWRHIYVYTPPDYEKDTTQRYPVLYLQHGGGEDERVWIEMGRTNLILDNLIAEGKIKPFIVVMETSAVGGPGPGAGRGAGAAAPAGAGAPAAGTGRGAGFGGMGMGGPGGGPYGQLMVNDLIPWVDSHFRTLADQPHRAMAGLSMGSMQTRSVTLANLDKFSYIGLFSGSTISMADVNDHPGFKDKVKLVFVSYGSREIGGNRGGRGAGAAAPAGRGPGAAPAGDPNAARRGMAAARGGRMGGGFGGNPQANVDALKAAGINAVFYVSPLTAHEFQSWRRSLREFSLLLFKEYIASSAFESAKKFVLRVDCGASSPFKDKFGNTWAADQEMDSGKTWGADNGSTMDREGVGITGTDIPRIYETERYSMGSYKFTVPNGKYTVRLHFSETFEGISGPGERVFSVSLGGQVVLKDLDPLKAAGALKPVVKEFKGVSVENGQLVIGFTPNVENPQICGIEILAE